MNWYRTSKLSYPYYIAISYEGRFVGMAPTQIKGTPMEKVWDRGGMGTGKKIKFEIKSSSAKTLLEEINKLGYNIKDQEVEFYIIRSPNSSRERLSLIEIDKLSRS